MRTTPGPLYLTTPIYYASGPPHIGHAYTTILADTIARYERRQRGKESVLFVTGTDEHGKKIEKAAAAAGESPAAFVGTISRMYELAWMALGVVPDEFVRTTSPAHEDMVRRVWEKMVASGDIYLGDYEGLYCEGCEAFVTEKDLSPTGLCPDHRTAPARLREESYFFRLSRYRDPLLAYYDAHPGFVFPQSRMNEVRRRVERGLEDLSISRSSCAWGIPVPGHPGHTVYVWLDALFSYLTGLHRPAPAGETALGDLGPFWPASDPPVYHLVGKEIVGFHAIFWPAFLMSVGVSPPRCVVSHGWWTVEGQKMSKSRGNVVDPVAFAERVHWDALRYFMLREIPVGEDGDFGRERFLRRYNDELCNDLGNLLNRTLAMVEKFSGGVLRQGPCDDKLADRARECAGLVQDAMARMQASEALEAVFALVRAGNVFLEEKAPFKLAKTDPGKAADALYAAADLLRVIAVMLHPFMPDRSAEMLQQIGLPEDYAEETAWGGIPDQTPVRRGDVLFPRIADEQMDAVWTRATGKAE